MTERPFATRIHVVNSPKEVRRGGSVEMQLHVETRATVKESQVMEAIPKWPEGEIAIEVTLLHPKGTLLSVHRSLTSPYQDAYFAALACILILEKSLGRFVSIEESPRKAWTMQFVLAEREGAFERFKTDLMKAAGRGEIGVVRSLIAGARGEIDRPSLTGHTAICYASERGHIDVVKLLIDSGAEVNIQGAEWTIAESALSGGLDILRTLLSAGLDPNLRNSYGETALMYASARGQVAPVQLLLDKGAALSLKDETGATASDWASRNNQKRIVQILDASKTN